MNPTSRKIGIPIRKPVIVNAQGALLAPNFIRRYRAMDPAPPDLSSSCPKIAPSPTIVAIKPSVLPIPFSMLAVISESGIPASIPTKTEVTSNARKALSLNLRTISSSKATPVNTTINMYTGVIIINYSRTTTTTSITFVPVGPVITRPPASLKKLYESCEAK